MSPMSSLIFKGASNHGTKQTRQRGKRLNLCTNNPACQESMRQRLISRRSFLRLVRFGSLGHAVARIRALHSIREPCPNRLQHPIHPRLLLLQPPQPL